MLARPSIHPEDQSDADEAADAEAIAEYEAKGGISHEAILAWVHSWGSESERPPPEVGD